MQRKGRQGSVVKKYNFFQVLCLKGSYAGPNSFSAEALGGADGWGVAEHWRRRRASRQGLGSGTGRVKTVCRT